MCVCVLFVCLFNCLFSCLFALNTVSAFCVCVCVFFFICVRAQVRACLNA